MKEHSTKYERVKFWYNNGFWDDEKLKKAVEKNWIIEEEYNELIAKNEVV